MFGLSVGDWLAIGISLLVLGMLVWGGIEDGKANREHKKRNDDT